MLSAILDAAPAQTLEFTTPDADPAAYTAACYAARDSRGAIRSWSLTQLDQVEFMERLRQVFPKERRTYYAPTVASMSGYLLPNEKFTIIYPVDRVRKIVRPGFRQGSSERIECDATLVQERDGFLFSGGGCLLVVLSGLSSEGTPFCIVSHAGRESLIDRLYVRTRKHSRPYFSVIIAMTEFARNRIGVAEGSLVLRSFFSLPSERFYHDPNDADACHREYNRKLPDCLIEKGLSRALKTDDEGKVILSLSECVRLQAEQEGIGRIDTARLGLPAAGDFAYTQHPEERMRGRMRNLVVLTRP